MRAIPVTDCNRDSLNLKRTQSLHLPRGTSTREGLPPVSILSDWEALFPATRISQVTSPAGDCFVFLGPHPVVLGIEGAFVLRSANIRNAHAGDHSAIDFIWREGTGTTQHNAQNASLGQGLPEWH